MLKTVRSFVRRERHLTKTQYQALELFSQFGLELSNGKVDFVVAFERASPIVLEIGFGMGQSLIEMALKYPEQNYIGIEVYRPGISYLLKQIAQHNLTNIKIYNADAVEVLRLCIPDNSLDKVLVFFPDPWPKRRHHKRRIIQISFLTLIHSKLKMNGILHIATDWDDYAQHILRMLSKISGFRNVAGSDKFVSRPDYRPLTRFEKRGLSLGHNVWDLMLEKDSSEVVGK